jgi:V-type H+-transporting ATPase 16kDa proteolipid subunit
MILSAWGSAWGTWRAGLGVCHMGIDHPAGIIKNIVPIVMAGVLGIYGLIVAVIITQSISQPLNSGYANTYSTFNGYTHFAAGLCCGLSCLAAGGTIGILGDVGCRGFGLKANDGKRWYMTGGTATIGSDNFGGGRGSMSSGNMGTEGANKLYVGLLIMLIFSEGMHNSVLPCGFESYGPSHSFSSSSGTVWIDCRLDIVATRLQVWSIVPAYRTYR